MTFSQNSCKKIQPVLFSQSRDNWGQISWQTDRVTNSLTPYTDGCVFFSPVKIFYLPTVFARKGILNLLKLLKLITFRKLLKKEIFEKSVKLVGWMDEWMGGRTWVLRIAYSNQKCLILKLFYKQDKFWKLLLFLESQKNYMVTFCLI